MISHILPNPFYLLAALILGVAIISFAATALAYKWLGKEKIVALPNARSSHQVPTPTGGGLGFSITTVFLLMILGLTFRDLLFIATSIGMLLLSLLGWRDDRKPLPPKFKFFIQILAATIVLPYMPPAVLTLLPGLNSAVLPLNYMLALLWVIGLTNVFNFMDGIDGIAAIMASCAGIFISLSTFVGLPLYDPFYAFTFGVLITGSTLGFLPFNFPKARVFMGDTGSLSLGFLLAIATLSAQYTKVLPIYSGALIVGPILFDTTLTLIIRLKRGEHFWQAHREHLYQRLSRWLGKHPPATLYFGLATGLCGCLALWLPAQSLAVQYAALIITILLSAGLAKWILSKTNQS